VTIAGILLLAKLYPDARYPAAAASDELAAPGAQPLTAIPPAIT
jgi:hypothetical protein